MPVMPQYTSNMLALRPLWQRNLMFSAQTPMQRCFRLGCRTRATYIHSGRLGPTDIRSPWMPWMAVMFDMRRTNGHSQVVDKLSDKNDALLVHFGATRLVDCASTRNERMPLLQGRGWTAILMLSDVVRWSRQLFRRILFFDIWHPTSCGSQKFNVLIETCLGHRLGAGRRV